MGSTSIVARARVVVRMRRYRTQDRAVNDAALITRLRLVLMVPTVRNIA